ncbi:DNA-binding protein HEXBP-like [Artemia franciscana]|uniref:CCHC-type domain-containing protein n=1 Tax=Artemia franciscana TaxID=6661 RepID=A0AA88L5U1_ARTSF|nr:hypothetical protein QYM36_009744 [Artemia franciscana]
MTLFARGAKSKTSNKKVPQEAIPGSKLKPNKRQKEEEEDDSEGMDEEEDEEVSNHGSDEEGESEVGEGEDEEAEDEMEGEEGSGEDEEESGEDEEENGDNEVTKNTLVQEEGKAKVNGVAQKKFKKEFKRKCFKCRQVGHKASVCADNPNRNKCFSCGKEGHKSKECATGNGHKFITCFVCSENGHFARECPEITKKGDKHIPSVSAKGKVGRKRKAEQENTAKSALNKKSKKGKVVKT